MTTSDAIPEAIKKSTQTLQRLQDLDLAGRGAPPSGNTRHVAFRISRRRPAALEFLAHTVVLGGHV